MNQRDTAVNEFLLAVEKVPGHGSATPRELQLAEALYNRAFQDGRASASGTQIGNGNVQINSF